jgi:hypothetical protein
MTTLDPTTLRADQLTAMLAAWSDGHLPDSAAVALLAGHGTWLGRRDFLAACVDAVDDGWTGGPDPAPMAAIIWTRVPAFAATTRASSGELAVLQLAASLAGVETGSLRDLTAGLGPNTLALVLDAIAHRAGWHENARTHQVTGRLPAPTPERLRPALTRLRDLVADAHRRDRALLDLSQADPDLWQVTPELAAAHPDLAPLTITVTDYRQVLTHPHTTGEAGDLLTRLIKSTRHLGYTLALGVDLVADPTGLDWLAPLPLARTVARCVPAAAGWDPRGYRANAAHALTTAYPPPRPARTATPAPSTPTPAKPARAAGRRGASRRGGTR